MLHHRLEIDSPSRGRKLTYLQYSSNLELSLEIDSPSRGRKLEELYHHTATSLDV